MTDTPTGTIETTTTVPTVTATDLEDLERLLIAQLDAHDELASCLSRGREAIRTARFDAVARVCADERAIVSRLQRMDRRRVAVVQRLSSPGSSAGEATISRIAADAGPERGGSLLRLAERLKSSVERARREGAVVRGAAEALSRHMTGLVRTMQASLCPTGVYGRRGMIAPGTRTDCCVDVKS